MDVGVIPEQPFHGRMVEISTVVDGSNLAWGASKDLWLPGVPKSRFQF